MLKEVVKRERGRKTKYKYVNNWETDKESFVREKWQTEMTKLSKDWEYNAIFGQHFPLIFIMDHYHAI